MAIARSVPTAISMAFEISDRSRLHLISTDVDVASVRSTLRDLNLGDVQVQEVTDLVDGGE